MDKQLREELAQGDWEAMSKNIVKAMQETEVKRIIAISSIDIYDTLRSALQPYRKLADMIEASDLDYTILRPEWFTNASEVNYQLTPKGQPERNSSFKKKCCIGYWRTH